MKKALLAGIATLTVFSASAAQPQHLPDNIIGSWCLVSDDENPVQALYNRINNLENFNECITETLPIDKDGYGEMWDTCLFDKIEQEGPNTYLVHARCEARSEGDGHGLGIFWTENKEYRIVDGQLVVTIIPEG